jgi:hypothetical protein
MFFSLYLYFYDLPFHAPARAVKDLTGLTPVPFLPLIID